MKIGIKGNSIRYRLSQTDMARFGEKGYLEGQTEFPDGTILCYRLEREAGITCPGSSFSGNSICIFVP
jgi:hypothetical protein